MDVTYTYDVNSILEVEAHVISTDERKKLIIRGKENRMSEEEIAARMKELSFLKIQPGDREENRVVLLRAEKAYEELLGDERKMLEYRIEKFEEALKNGNRDTIREEREKLLEVLNTLW